MPALLYRSFLAVALGAFAIMPAMAEEPVMTVELGCGASMIRLVCDFWNSADEQCPESHAELILANGQTKIVTTPKVLAASQIPIGGSSPQRTVKLPGTP